MGPDHAARTVDLNADLGEEITDDEGLLDVVTSANVACGYHAGTTDTMRRVCARGAADGVAIGAQVSYADRENFGRVEHEVDPDVLARQVADQVGRLTEIARSEGTVVAYLKPHGALYHRTARDEEQARAVLHGSGDLPVLGMAGSRLLVLARAAGRGTALEGFPDRAYLPNGGLRPRDEPGAVLVDDSAITAQALALAPEVDSLCLHGDTPGAVDHARSVRHALVGAGWSLAAIW